jgi:hypothetical protein
MITPIPLGKNFTAIRRIIAILLAILGLILLLAIIGTGGNSADPDCFPTGDGNLGANELFNTTAVAIYVIGNPNIFIFSELEGGQVLVAYGSQEGFKYVIDHRNFTRTEMAKIGGRKAYSRIARYIDARQDATSATPEQIETLTGYKFC